MKAAHFFLLILIFVVPWYLAKWGMQLYAFAVENTRFAVKSDAKLQPKITAFNTLSAGFLASYFILVVIMLIIVPKDIASRAVLYKKIFGYPALHIDIKLAQLTPAQRNLVIAKLNPILQEGHLHLTKEGYYSEGRRVLSSRTYTEYAHLASRYRFQGDSLQIVLPNQSDFERLWLLEKAWQAYASVDAVPKMIGANLETTELSVEPHSLYYQRYPQRDVPCEMQLKAHLQGQDILLLQVALSITSHNDKRLLSMGGEWPGFFKRYHLLKLSDLPPREELMKSFAGMQQSPTKPFPATLHLQAADVNGEDYRSANCEKITALEAPIMASLRLKNEEGMKELMPYIKGVSMQSIKRYKPWRSGAGWQEAKLDSVPAGWHWQAQ